MAFFKKKKLNDGKWHAVAVNLRKSATIDDVADRLSRRSTVSRADAYAVLVELGDVIGELIAEGRPVKLKGVGSFRLTCRTKGQGKESPDEVTPKMITDVKVRFVPEYSRGSQNQVTRRTMVSRHLKWIEYGEPEG